MITRIKIDGFKSFQNFEVELAPFTVVAGANGSGKSNLFDALWLLSRLVQMPIAQALGDQRSGGAELFTIYPDGKRASKMEFEVDLLLNESYEEAKLLYRRVTYSLVLDEEKNKQGLSDVMLVRERLTVIPPATDTWMQCYYSVNWSMDTPDQPILWAINGGYRVSDVDNHEARLFFDQESVMEFARKTIIFHEKQGKALHIRATANMLSNIHVFDFQPTQLRSLNDKQGPSDLQENGDRLAATLYRIQETDPEGFRFIKSDLALLVPEFRNLEVLYSDITEQYVLRSTNTKGQVTTSRVLSDGTLKIIGLVTLVNDEQYDGITCLEEPENGVHPFLLKRIVKSLELLATDLTQADPEEPLRQVIVNTHSPTLVARTLELQNTKVLYAESASLVNSVEQRTLQVTRMREVVQQSSTWAYQTKNAKTDQPTYVYAKDVIEYLKTSMPTSESL